MGEGEESQKISGLVAFLSKPDNSLMLSKLFSDVETIIYHKVGLGVAINEKDVYELGRYIGKAQLLIDFGTYIMIHSKDEKLINQIGKKIFQLVNDISDLYLVLESNTNTSSFDYTLSLFKMDISDLKDLISKFLNV